MNKYTKEQLIFYLKKLSSKLKKTATIKDMATDKSSPSPSTYLKRFKSWNNALRAAGLKLNSKKQYTKEELSENIKIIYKELGRVPMPGDLKDKKWTGSYSTYLKYFGNWNNVLRIAKIPHGRSSSLTSFVKKN